MSEISANERDRPTTSTRDKAELHDNLAAWLATKVDSPTIGELNVPESNGMSSETVLFSATWRDESGAVVERDAVARLAPDAAAMPVFPVYDLEKQYRVMKLVAARTTVPVPQMLWLENDARHLGSPFFVMARVDGIVPPDVMPYNFGNTWLFDASPDDQRRLQESSVAALAGIHGAEVTAADIAFLQLDAPGDTALRRHVADLAGYYEWVVADGLRSPLIERGFAWLDEHWPADENPDVISWGDARIGNVMYRDFEPVAVLDWEMAAVGPPEIDLGWMIFLHRFFEDLTKMLELPGMPHFMRRDDLAASYEKASGYTPRDLDFFTAYAALRQAVVMSRVNRRSIHFGEAEMPDDPDALITHRASLEAMLDGTYWDGVS